MDIGLTAVFLLFAPFIIVKRTGSGKTLRCAVNSTVHEFELA